MIRADRYLVYLPSRLYSGDLRAVLEKGMGKGGKKKVQ